MKGTTPFTTEEDMAKKKQIEQIKKELESGRDREGLIHPSEREQWAARNPNSALHDYLDWDDAKLGRMARTDQIRVFLAIHFKDQTGNRELVALSVDLKEGSGGYRRVNDVMSRKDLIQCLKEDIIAELVRLRTKHSVHDFKEFAPIWRAIDAVERLFKTRKGGKVPAKTATKHASRRPEARV